MAAEDSSLRSLTMLAYILLLGAALNGLTAIAAVVIAYVKKPDAEGSVWESHARNIILVFWVTFAGLLLGWLSFPISIGLIFSRDITWSWLSIFSLPVLFWLLVFPVLAIWFLYRVIRGLVRASEGREY